MFRHYNYYWTSFHQPDPYDGSYNLTNPQSFNRSAYVQSDPMNFIDPFGLDPAGILGTLLGNATARPILSTVTVNIGNGEG